MAAARTSDVGSNKRANGGSRSIHTFLSITGRSLKLLNNRDWGGTLWLRGGLRSFVAVAGAASPALLNFFTASQTAAAPSHFPITGQLRRIISTGL